MRDRPQSLGDIGGEKGVSDHVGIAVKGDSCEEKIWCDSVGPANNGTGTKGFVASSIVDLQSHLSIQIGPWISSGLQACACFAEIPEDCRNVHAIVDNQLTLKL